MAAFCHFIEVSADGTDLGLLARLRKQLSHERESFGICLQALSQLLGLNLNELILYDRSFVMKDDVVSMYLSGGLPDGMSDLIANLESRPARKHAVAVQFGKLLKECVQHGLEDVVQGLDGAPAKDLYSRSIACLLRINMCALRVECGLRRREGEAGGAGSDCVLDETGTSLCELLSRCCLILCIFGAEDSNLFEDVREVQETLLRLVPEPLVLHIIGAFAVVAFDNDCLFSLHSRRVFVETLATILPELLDRVLLFNRLGSGGATETIGPRQPRLDPTEEGGGGGGGGSTSLGSTWSTGQLKTTTPLVANLYHTLGPGMDDVYSAKSAVNIGTPYWEYAFGNIPRVRTLSLLLDFILMVMRIARDGTVDKQMFGWLDALVTKPSFFQAFKPIFSSGDTSNFHKIMEMSRILGKDVFVSHLILSVRHNTREALDMIKAAGPGIIMSDTSNRPKILSFMVEGVLKQPQPFIKGWYDLLEPLVGCTPKGENRGGERTNSWPANVIMDGAISEVGDSLLEAVIPHSLMQNFGDECHPDEDNVHVCTARQVMVLLVEVIGKKRIATKVHRFMEAAYRLMQEPVTVETVQIFEFAVFIMWLLKMYELNVRNKKLHAFVKEVNERTLEEAIVLYNTGNVSDPVTVRLEALEDIKKRIRASRLRHKVDNHEAWFDDQQIKEATMQDWDKYYKEFGDEMLQQLMEAIIERPPAEGAALTVANSSSSNSSTTTTIKSAANSKQSRGTSSTNSGEKGKKTSDEGKGDVTVAEYIDRIKLVVHLHSISLKESIPDDLCATIMAALVHFNVAEEECIHIMQLMLDRCPDSLLYRVVESGVARVNIALMKVMTQYLHDKHAGVLSAMMGMTLGLKSISGDGVGIIVSLMHLVAKAVSLPTFFAELIMGDDELATLQNFIVFTNGFKLTSHSFLEARCAMNLALMECYLQYEVPHTTVPVVQFVQARIQRVMEVRAAQFSIVLGGGTNAQQGLPAAKGELNTLDLIVVTTFQLFFIANTPPKPMPQRCWDRGDNDVFHWNLVGREYHIAFKTITLLFKCFCQLTMTKLMFIAEHFIGVAARINGDKHSTARRRILTDDSMLNQDAIEYFYQVYRNVKRRFVELPPPPTRTRKQRAS